MRPCPAPGGQVLLVVGNCPPRQSTDVVGSIASIQATAGQAQCRSPRRPVLVTIVKSSAVQRSCVMKFHPSTLPRQICTMYRIVHGTQQGLSPCVVSSASSSDDSDPPPSDQGRSTMYLLAKEARKLSMSRCCGATLDQRKRERGMAPCTHTHTWHY